MKPTITNLAKHIGKTRGALYETRKTNPALFDLIKRGWEEYCKEKNMEGNK